MKTKEVIAVAELIRLTHEENKRFVSTLKNPPKANAKLKRLFKKHSIKQP